MEGGEKWWSSGSRSRLWWWLMGGIGGGASEMPFLGVSLDWVKCRKGKQLNYSWGL